MPILLYRHSGKADGGVVVGCQERVSHKAKGFPNGVMNGANYLISLRLEFLCFGLDLLLEGLVREAEVERGRSPCLFEEALPDAATDAGGGFLAAGGVLAAVLGGDFFLLREAPLRPLPWDFNA